MNDAMAATAEYWDQVAVHGLESATDAFELAKAKELAHEAHDYRWRASKIAPKLYGDKQTVEGKFTVDWAQICLEAAEKYKKEEVDMAATIDGQPAAANSGQ